MAASQTRNDKSHQRTVIHPTLTHVGSLISEFAAKSTEVLLWMCLLCLGNPAIALGRSVVLRPAVTRGLLFSG